jgi:hypothetical protein
MRKPLYGILPLQGEEDVTADLVLCKYCRCLVEPDEPHYCTLEDANG